jgi:uncharacterized damage-inducible protein DinB
VRWIELTATGMKSQKMKVLIPHIINQLMAIQEGKVWVGSTYESKLRQINEENAFIRPLPDMHSVAEIVAHLTTWRKESILKIRTGKGSLTDDDEANWYANEKLKEQTWAAILADYKASLSTLIELLNSKEDDFLNQTYYDTDFKGNYPYSFVIDGMLHHDIYHLGQIGMIVKYLEPIG